MLVTNEIECQIYDCLFIGLGVYYFPGSFKAGIFSQTFSLLTFIILNFVNPVNMEVATDLQCLINAFLVFISLQHATQRELQRLGSFWVSLDHSGKF